MPSSDDKPSPPPSSTSPEESPSSASVSTSSDNRAEKTLAEVRPYLPSRDRATLDELNRLDPRLGGLFRAGLELLPRLSEPGIPYLVAHAGREIANGVERILAGEGEQPPTPDEETEASEKNRDRIGAILGLSPDHQLVRMWFRVKRVFSDSCHFGANPTPETIRDAFGDFARLLFGRVGPYFATHAELDELIRVEHPTQEDVERAARLLLRPQQRHHFFSALANPGWLGPLEASGQFAFPPDRDVRPDSWSPRAWPQGQYLVRVASSRPDDVARVLARIPRTNSNPAVWGAAISAALAMPASVAATLVPAIQAALKHESGFTLAHDSTRLVRHLGAGGERAAFALADALLWFVSADRAEPATTGSSPQRPRPNRALDASRLLSRMDDWELREFIDKAVPALEQLDSAKTCELLTRKVRRAVFLMDSASPEELQGPGATARWCRRVGAVTASDDVRETLTNALAGVAARASAAGRDQALLIWKQLGCDGETFERIRWVVLASAGSRLQSELDSVVGGDGLVSPPFGAGEAAALLRAQFSNASQEARQLFVYALERGPAPEELLRRVSLRRERESTASPRAEGVGADFVAEANEWRAKRLRWFHDRIPPELQAMAARVGASPGVPSSERQDLDEIGWHVGGGTWGNRDTSPLTGAELAERSSADIAQFLQEWPGPSESFGRGPSRTGLEQVLTDFGQTNTTKALEVAELCCAQGGPFTYIVSLLRGAQSAVAREEEGPWERLLTVAIRAAAAASSATNPRDQGSWWDPTRGTISAALKIAREACNKSKLPLPLADRAWALVSDCIRYEKVWADEGAKPSEKLGDLIDSSLNSLSGVAVWTMLDVALWRYREAVRARGLRTSDEPHLAEIEARLAPLLSVVMGHQGRTGLIARAMLGGYVPQILLLAPEWAGANEDPLFTDGAANPLRNPVWGAYLARGGFFDSVFTRLRRWYEVAADSILAVGDPLANERRWAPSRGLADHVLVALVRGLVRLGDADRLVEKTFSAETPTAKSEVYWAFEAAWNKKDAAVPPEFVARLLGFWEWRLSELERAPRTPGTDAEAEALLRFISLPQLQPSDAIRLGIRTARLLPKPDDRAYVPWESLGRLAAADAVSGFELVERLVERSLDAKYPYLPFDELAPALRAALLASDENIRGRGAHLINVLGERGFVEFGRLLQPPAQPH